MSILNLEYKFQKNFDADKGPRSLFWGFKKDEKPKYNWKALKLENEGPCLTTLAEKTKSLNSLKASQNRAQSDSYQDIYTLGIGQEKDFFSKNLLHWGGLIAREIQKSSLKALDIYIDSFFNPPSSMKSKKARKDFAGRDINADVPSLEDSAEKLLLGIELGLYQFDQHKSEKLKERKLEIRLISQKLTPAKANACLAKMATLADAIYETRDLQNEPGNHLTPELLAKKCQKLSKEAGLKCIVFDEKKIATENLNGITAVGKGSKNPPRFIIMEHKKGPKSGPTFVIVGKGVTFDTGGISLKPSANMELMKMDMSGAAATAGLMYALGKSKAKVNVIALIASAENMPGANATKPGDVYTSHSGLTVEVINTDAEGRLVLADALSYAKKFKPDYVIDLATLTGAVLVALGNPATGVMGNNGKLTNAYLRAAENAGERGWELPLFDFYHKELKSDTADLRNIARVREGGAQVAGSFLNHFVDNDYAWLHLDIASTGMENKAQGAHCPNKSGTGIPVNSLYELITKHKKLLK